MMCHGETSEKGGRCGRAVVQASCVVDGDTAFPFTAAQVVLVGWLRIRSLTLMLQKRCFQLQFIVQRLEAASCV